MKWVWSTKSTLNPNKPNNQTRAREATDYASPFTVSKKQVRPYHSLTSFLPDNTIGPKEEIPIHSVNKQPIEMVCAFAITGIQEGHCGQKNR